MSEKFFKKNDLLLLGILIAIFFVILFFTVMTKKESTFVQVRIDGEITEVFPLSEDLEFEIHGYNGGTNTLIIEGGKAYLKDTSCPDHLCEKMGKISKSGQSLICLPNHVVVEISGGKETEYDAVVGG